MTKDTAPSHHWSLRLATILWFLFGLGFLLALPILLQATGWALPLVVLLAALLALPLAWLIRKVRGTARRFTHTWFKCGLALLFVLSILLATPIYYLATITQMHPVLAPQVTLTNGDKTIVFQGMQHVGSERFFKSVVYDLEDALSRGDVLYYEGVRPSNPEGDGWFNRMLAGGGDLTANYRDLGGLCGLQFQNDYFQMLARDAQIHPESHVAADVSTLDMKHEYDRLIANDAAFAKAMAVKTKVDAPSPDMMEAAIRYLKHGTEGQRAIAGIVCRGVLTLVLGSASGDRPANPMDRVIIDFRNRQLAARLLAEPRKNIYITYGAMHLPGLFALLRKSDGKWHVASVKWMRTIDAPQKYSGQIPGLEVTGN